MKNIVESYRRKLAAEDGWVCKRGAQLRIALCYPNVYSIGMANLGFQAMYEIFNNIPDVSCERVLLPDSVSASRGDRGSSPTVREGVARKNALAYARATAPAHPRNSSGYDQAARDRADAPIDEMREYERTRTPLLSLESHTPVRDFDVVAFSSRM